MGTCSQNCLGTKEIITKDDPALFDDQNLDDSTVIPLNPEEHRPQPEYATFDLSENEYSSLFKLTLEKLPLFIYDKSDKLEHKVVKFPEQFRIHSNNSKYTGTWLNGLPNGKGKMYYSDGTLYEGYITEGFPEKKGRKIYANGDFYLGEFQKGEFNGLGEYHQYKGVKLIGNFKNGVLNGEGKEQWPSCITYNGKFKDGKKHGRGRLEYPVENKNKKKKDKDVENPVSTEEQKTEEYYEGMFQNGEFNGKGVYVWADGRRYEGRFVNGKMNGKGVFTWKDERKYDGYYLDDVKHGLGEYSWPDGRKWKGGWKFGLQHGRGVLISKDPLDNEIVKRGIWVNGKREVWLDHLATEWPKGIDEVNLDIFDIEEEEEEEEEKEEEGLFGKIGNVFGELGDKFKSVVSNSKPDMDEYLKEYCRSYMPPLLERPDSLNSPYHGLNGVKSPNNNEGFSGFYNGKTRDPKDNIFIRNEKNNTSLNGNDKKDGSVIRQEFNNMKSKNSSVDLKNGENILPQDEKNKIIKPNDNEKKNDESLVKQKSYQMIDEKGKLVL